MDNVLFNGFSRLKQYQLTSYKFKNKYKLKKATAQYNTVVLSVYSPIWYDLPDSIKEILQKGGWVRSYYNIHQLYVLNIHFKFSEFLTALKKMGERHSYQ